LSALSRRVLRWELMRIEKFGAAFPEKVRRLARCHRLDRSIKGDFDIVKRDSIRLRIGCLV
jgi:hypothetical protein